MESKSDPEAVASGAPDAIADPDDVQLLGEMRSNPRWGPWLIALQLVWDTSRSYVASIPHLRYLPSRSA